MKLQQAVLASVLATALTGAAWADVECPPNPGAVTIDDNVIVTGVCVLDRTQVKGNVLVTAQGALTVRDARIEGNLQADGGLLVRVIRSDIGGDIQIKGLFGEVSRIQRSSIGGNLQLENNRVPLVADYNSIDGDLQAFANFGRLSINHNVIGGNLQCKENRPAPTGINNLVSGNKEDQCAKL